MGEVGCLKDGKFQNLQVEGTTLLNDQPTSALAPESSFASAAYTAITGAGALARNSFNTVDAGGSIALTLPTRASSTKGDFVHILLIDTLANGHILKIGTATEDLSLGSRYVGIPSAARVGTTALAVAPNDFFNMTGLTNGDGGIGSTVDCYFNGTSWSLTSTCYPQGAASADGTSVFANA